MPLVHANRSLVKHSLSRANTREGRALIPGISALLEKAGASEFTVRTYGWVIGPHLNAAGRIAHARIAANLVAARSMATIADGVEELVATNRDRKQVQERVQDEAMKQATELIEACPDRRFLVLYGKDWHPGVVGIVAGRVRERFRLPAIVCGLHPDGGFWKGSARSIGGCDLGHLSTVRSPPKRFLAGVDTRRPPAFASVWAKRNLSGPGSKKPRRAWFGTRSTRSRSLGTIRTSPRGSGRASSNAQARLAMPVRSPRCSSARRYRSGPLGRSRPTPMDASSDSVSLCAPQRPRVQLDVARTLQPGRSAGG